MTTTDAEIAAAQSLIADLEHSLAEARERAERAEAELCEYRAYWEPYVKELGDEHTRQGGELSTLRQLAIDLLNQLTVLRMPDESALVQPGGQGLERAYQALKREVGSK